MRTGCSRWCGPGSASAARCCVARSHGVVDRRAVRSRRRRADSSGRGARHRRVGSARPRGCAAWMRSIGARAKLTVSLRITGRRADGYHLLDAEMVSLDLHDRLEFADGDGLDVIGPAAAGVPPDDTNLIRRALVLVGRTAQVRVDKHIPAGARARRRVERCGRDPPMGGGRRCRARRVARRRRPVLPVRRPGAGDAASARSRAACLASLVRSRSSCRPSACRRPTSTAVGRARAGRRGSTATTSSPRRCRWTLGWREWRQRIEAATGARPTLAGSGSTWFVDGDHSGSAGDLSPARVVVARTPGPSSPGFEQRLEL